MCRDWSYQMPDLNESDAFASNEPTTTVPEPSPAKKPARRPARKAAKSPVNIQVSQMQAFLDSCVDTSGPGAAIDEVRDRIDGSGIAYLADGTDIYGVALSPAEYDKLVQRASK